MHKNLADLRQRVPFSRVVLVSLLAGGLGMLCIQIKAPANIYDEGLTLLNANRILLGQAPYRDYWTLYAPGYFYLLAGLFKLAAPSILIARILDTGLRFFLTLQVYTLARSMTTRWVALIPWAWVTLWLAAIRFYSYPAFPATAMILAALLALLRYLASHSRRWLALTGLALGVTAILRLDFGGYAALGTAVAVAIFDLQRTTGSRLSWRKRLASLAWLPTFKAESILGLCALAVALPLYAYLAAASGLTTMWTDLVVFPATTFRAVRHLPVPDVLPDLGRMSGAEWEDWVRLYLPLGIYAAALVMSVRWLIKHDAATDRRIWMAPLLIAMVGIGLGLVVKATSRYHELHALPTAILAVIVATALACHIPSRLWRMLPFGLGVGGLIFLFTFGPYVLHFTEMFTKTYQYEATGCYSSLERAGCVPIAPDQSQAIEYIQARTHPGEYVFVGNHRHDLSFANDLLFNFLADRPSPTRYTELHPGLATTWPIQHTIVQDLTTKNVQWVVTFRNWDPREPNDSSVSSNVTYLDDFIRENYSGVATLGSYRIWQKRH